MVQLTFPRNESATNTATSTPSVHNWYRFVLGFDAQLVADYLAQFNVGNEDRVLDPFAGTGTTLVECKKRRIASIGIEANPMAVLAISTKTDWTPSPSAIRDAASEIAETTCRVLMNDGIPDTPTATAEVGQDANMSLRTLTPDLTALVQKNAISPRPLHKALSLLAEIKRFRDAPYYNHLRLAFATTVVHKASNLRFGPEVGLGKVKSDASVVAPWLQAVYSVADAIQEHRELARIPSTVHHADSRAVGDLLAPETISTVITSPPYPNEKDYTRTTRLESVLLGLITTKSELQALKKGLVRSNTRSVYKADTDDLLISWHPEIKRIAQAIETRRIELGKTSGFEKLYPRLTQLYFGGMYRHLADLRRVLRPGAQLAYVVGDQASYLQVPIETARLLGELAESLGYHVIRRDLFRTRIATATKAQLREEVLILRWPNYA